MNDDSLNPLTPLDEQLVAYLDGELDAEEARRIEELLATDANVRRRLQELERTWNLLDDLDMAPASGQFVQTTLEMVAVAASQDVEQSLAEAPRRRRRRFFIVLGSFLAAGVVGFLAVAAFWPDPDRQLVEQLPVLENLEQYHPVGDIKYLHMLRGAGLFLQDDDETPAAAAGRTSEPNESLDQRRRRIREMDLADKQQLVRLKERFDGLDADQQQRLCDLDAALDADPDGRELRQIMRRYCEWLKAIPSSYTRAELTEMKLEDRLKAVKKHVQVETRQADRRLGRKDSEALIKWLNDYVAHHEKQLLDTLPQQQRKRMQEATEQMRHRMLLWHMWQQRQMAGPGKPPSSMTDDDLAALRERLTPKASKRLEQKPIPQQWQIVGNWVRDVARQRWMRGSAPSLDDERLVDFFENGIDDDDRDRLLSMPGEEMQRELLRLYMTRGNPSETPRAHHPEGERKHNRRPSESPQPKKVEKGDKDAKEKQPPKR
jgi:hypothetical protein